MTRDFFDLSYLQSGSLIQRKGYEAIQSSGVMDALSIFTPVVVGTLPLDIFTKKSDIDIICHFHDQEFFNDELFAPLDQFDYFAIDTVLLGDDESVIARFKHAGFDFEIVGQSIIVTQQKAYRHMLVEWEVLCAKDETFKKEIIALKESGLKTEPAFAKLLGLKGDPYEALLTYNPKP